MPLMPFATENRITGGSDYPTVKLRKDERARISIADLAPTFEFVHTLRAPKINADGTVKMETVKNAKGEDTEQMEWEFVGRHICFGDVEKLQDKGFDPDDCPTCRRSAVSDAIRPPERRFAIHTVQYANLRAGTFEVVDPFGLSMKAWVLSDKLFNQLIDIKGEHGDLRRLDLTLGPCQQEKYQKFDVNVGSVARWSTKPEWIEIYKQVMENRCEDLAVVIGRRSKVDYVMQDIAKCEARFNQAFPDKAAAISGALAAAVIQKEADDLSNGILNEAFVAPSLEDMLGEPAGNTGDITIHDAPPAPVVTEATASADADIDFLNTPVLETKTNPGSVADFDDILNSLA